MKYSSKKSNDQRTRTCSKRNFALHSQNSQSINCWPNEILLQIFSYLTKQDLYYGVNRVCTKWSTLSKYTCLWTKIVVEDNVATDVVLNWLDMAPNLKELYVYNRFDATVILKKISKKNRKLEKLVLENCWASESKMFIPAKPLCDVVSRCKKLICISLQNSEFKSCKFFQLLVRHSPTLTLRLKPILYFGNINIKQLTTFLYSLKDSDMKTMTLHNDENGAALRLSDVINWDNLADNIKDFFNKGTK